MTSSTDVFVRFGSSDAVEVDLVCVPWVGAGAAPFHAWRAQLPHRVGILAARRPGRESRLMEPAEARLHLVVGEMADHWEAHVGSPRVLFGHCLGAVIAFELVRELRRRGLPEPAGLIAVSSAAPNEFTRDRDRGELSDDLAEQEAILGNARLFSALRPAIEADLLLGRHYLYVPGDELRLPVTLLGTRSEPMGGDDAEAWGKETSGVVKPSVGILDWPFPGGDWLGLADLVLAEVEPLVRGSTP